MVEEMTTLENNSIENITLRFKLSQAASKGSFRVSEAETFDPERMRKLLSRQNVVPLTVYRMLRTMGYGRSYETGSVQTLYFTGTNGC